MKRKFIELLFLAVALCPFPLAAQTQQSPLTSREIVALVYQLPKHPEMRDEIVEEIRNAASAFR